MLLLVGLGNPGAEYAANRHNIGFMAVDAIARRHGFGPWKKKFAGEAADGEIAGVKALILKPMTYMNESGRSVAEAARFLKIAPADIVVFHDELDLPPAKLRVKTGGGHAGHNGLRSIQAHLGPEFRRVRLGIGHPGDRERVTGWVLGDFAKADREWLDLLFDAVAAAAPKLAANADEAFASDVALVLSPPRNEARKTDGAPARPAPAAGPTTATEPPRPPANAMAEALRALLAQKKPPGRKGPR